jgi:hypothetical protein
MGHILLAQAQEASAPPLATFADVVRFFLLLLLAVALLILVVNSWRACNRLTEIRDLLRRSGGGAEDRWAPEDVRRPPP